MPSPTLIVGPTSRAVREKTLELLRAALTRGGAGIPFSDGAIIFRSSEAAERAWLQALRAQPDAAGRGTWLPRFSDLNDWFVDVVSLCAPDPIRWVTPADRRFILRDLLPPLARELHELRSLARSSDLVRQLDVFIADLRRAGCTQVPRGGDWSRDLQTILSAYDGRLAAVGGTDIECALGLFAQGCQTWPRRPSCVVFDQIMNPAPVLWRGIQAMAERVPEVVVPLVVPGLSRRPGSWDELVALTDGTITQRIVHLWAGFAPDAKIVAVGDVAGPRVGAVAGLLRHPRTGTSQPAPCPVPLTVTAAHTPRDEIARIAAHIRAGCDDVADLGRVTVVLPDAAKYAGIIEPAFAEHGLSVRVRRARPHSTYPLVRRLLRLFSLCEMGWRVDALAEIFGDGLFQLCHEEHSLDARRLRHACIRARHDNFQDLELCRQRLRIADCGLRIDGEPDELDASHPSSLTSHPSEIERDLDCIGHLREVCQSTQGILTVHEWAAALHALRHMVAGHLEGRADDPGAAEARQQVQLIEQAIDAVVLRAARWLGGVTRDAKDYFDWLRLELEGATSPLVAESGAAVEVVGPLLLNGGIAGMVYFGGLLEGDWPSSAVPGSLVARHQVELAAIREHLPDAMQLAVHQLGICLSEADALHLSYPTLRGGRDTLRSPLLEDLLHLWPDVPPLESPPLPTSRTGVLARLGEWTRDNHGVFSSILASPICETASIDGDLLGTLLQVRRDRFEANVIGPYDGALGVEGAGLVRQFYTATGMARRLDGRRLKAYAQCPLKYFYRYVLHLQPPARWEDDLESYQSGNLVHAILQRFLREYDTPLTAATWSEAWGELAKLAEEEVEKLEVRPVLRAAELCRLLGSSPHEPGGLLAPVLDAEIAHREGTAQRPAFASPLVPLCRTEQLLPASLNGGIAAEFWLKVEGDTVQDRVDRIDVAPDGSIVLVSDYKTARGGNLAGFDKINEGLDFQLALHLLGARREFCPDRAAAPALAAAYFATSEAEYRCRIGMTGSLGRKARSPREQELSPDEFHTWLDGLEASIGRIAHLIERGQFNLSLNDARDAGCAFCDYQTICRQNAHVQPERRAAHTGRADVYLPSPLLSPTKNCSDEPQRH